jgi:hypothetical protein
MWTLHWLGLDIPLTADFGDSMITEYEKAWSMFEKINHQWLSAVRNHADVLKPKSKLLQQILQHQQEINELKKALSQQNTHNVTESSKAKERSRRCRLRNGCYESRETRSGSKGGKAHAKG